MSPGKKLSGTDLVHADDEVALGLQVAPAISVSTTFRNPDLWAPGKSGPETFDPRDPERHVYSRYTQETSTRAERVLSRINDGYALTYSCGLAAAYAAFVHLKPKRIAITKGYPGVHTSIEVYNRARDVPAPVIDIDDPFRAGDVVWLETPLNPTGEARDIQYYADKIHAVGGRLIVDSTFAPPPLQYPFKWGADIVHHSGTKYFGGHSDMLCGVLVVKTKEEWTDLWSTRTFLGSVSGSLEAWLLLRSLRTLHLRVPRQSASAAVLATWLSGAAGAHDGIPADVVERVHHSSLQGRDARGWEPSAQLEGGWNPTFAIVLTHVELAARLPHDTRLFVPATSLGGVESLIEHRVSVDPAEHPRLVRLSVGVEDVDDLRDDLRQALQAAARGEVRARVAPKL
ncbi:cystathionine gamma-synthase [Phanerochaete sordida]|uniref:Cystathionine gamma-synthase n=1 Tax=Phanerochaete sordida TaxID=48140 RepID=A0A9P3GJU5_9APHY|nr:cystathionine gamma-synthase [Phanerochaete sordida]